MQRVTWRVFALHFCSEPEMHPNIFIGVTFHTYNNPDFKDFIPCVESGESIQRLLWPGQVFWKMSVLHNSQTIDHERCPVKYYKISKSHRPAEMNKPEPTYYFTNKHQQNPGDNIWY